MGQKEKLILYLINCSERLSGIHGLIMLFDRVDFPGKVGESLDKLLDEKLIEPREFDKYGHPIFYRTTEDGIDFLRKNFYSKEILDYVKTMDNPEFLEDLMEKWLEKIKFN